MGQIIPAIATTTAAVAGLLVLELFKVVGGPRPRSAFRCSYLRLAENFFSRHVPPAPAIQTVSSRHPTHTKPGFSLRLPKEALLQLLVCSKTQTLKSAFSPLPAAPKPDWDLSDTGSSHQPPPPPDALLPWIWGSCSFNSLVSQTSPTAPSSPGAPEGEVMGRGD